MNITDFGFADGKVVEVRSTLQSVVVSLVDWKEEQWCLVFDNALAVENLNVEGEELERVEVSSNSAYIDSVRELVGEPDAEMKLFEFYTAWGDKPRLRVIAASAAIEPRTVP